ncbi:MAG: DUF192 domain-containing protein [Candidatus Pacearchaeota archaeon]
MKKVKIFLKKRKICTAILCSTLFERMFGLILRKKQSALIVLPKVSRSLAAIHTFFMLFSIDAFWLDENKTIVDVAKNIRPFCLSVVPKEDAKFILETPAGIADLKIGDRLKFIVD